VASRFIRVAAIVCGLTCALASPVSAGDWLLTPYIGTTFGARSNVYPLGNSGGDKKLTIGGAAGFLTDGIFGAEANTSYSFGFFRSESGPVPSTLNHSAVGTLIGDVLIAMPVAVTHESLRPYAAVGIGLMHAAVEDITVQQPHRNLVGMDIGGGAIGFVTRGTGFRFDLRRLHSLTREPSMLPLSGGSQLAFWRLSVGVIVRR
jgi:hypothetical protein